MAEGRDQPERPQPPSGTVAVLGLRRVEQIMGTAIGFDIRDTDVSVEALDEAVEYLRTVDRRFSTHKPDSQVSRLSRGEISEAECSPDVRQVLKLCEELREISQGYFDIRGHRWDGGLDPSGMVRGWALENAGRIVEEAGGRNYCINAGGDIVVRGQAGPGKPWRIGIRHPLLPGKVASVVTLRFGAVATTGAYERGELVRDPFTGKAPDGILSFTVVGPSLTYADAYATAAFAMGKAGLAWVAGLAGYAGCSITADPDGSNGRLSWTPGFERCFADPY
jgi:FAD:protein FMN transferase